jgi:hypothetical protein
MPGLITGQEVDAQAGAVAGVGVDLIEDRVPHQRPDRSQRKLRLPVRSAWQVQDYGTGGGLQAVREDLTLSSTERLSVGTLGLEVGSVSESVPVTGEATPVQVTSQERSAVLNDKQMAYLSTPGRDYMNHGEGSGADRRRVSIESSGAGCQFRRDGDRDSQDAGLERSTLAAGRGES